jgi:hypothetical protein
MTKEYILDAIRKAAIENNGIALGMGKFFDRTGIRREDWEGKIWAKWSDAIKEAGYEPNEFSSPAFDIDWIMLKVIELIRELNQFPSRPQFKIKNYKDKSFPTSTTLTNRLGNKSDMITSIIEFCNKNEGYDDVISICSAINVKPILLNDNKVIGSNDELGYVYLTKSGKYYKIGKSNHVGRRDYELKIQLPEKVQLIHQISTDDPSGIEIYWHNRFSKKRKNGEWFELNNEDIRVFKRRKFM